jgi:hypothetical protein
VSLFIIYGFLALMLYNQSLVGPFCFVLSHLSQQPTPKLFPFACLFIHFSFFFSLLQPFFALYSIGFISLFKFFHSAVASSNLLCIYISIFFFPLSLLVSSRMLFREITDICFVSFSSLLSMYKL